GQGAEGQGLRVPVPVLPRGPAQRRQRPAAFPPARHRVGVEGVHPEGGQVGDRSDAGSSGLWEVAGCHDGDDSRKRGASGMKKSRSKIAPTEPIEAAVDWRSELLSRLRALIMEADPEMTEERKWVKPSNPAGVPTWSHNGQVCTGET